MQREERTSTGLQLRRMGFPPVSRYGIVRRLFIGDLFVGRFINPLWNQLNLISTYVSKVHCSIECRENGQIFLHDTSTNGTFVNGKLYSKETIELRQNDKIGVGFPVNETNAMSGKAFFGFILEREPIKREIKTEIEDGEEEEGELMIDEFARSRSVTPSEVVHTPPSDIPMEQNPIAVPPPEPVIAQVDDVDDMQFSIELKEELIKRELEDDMGSYTDDDDDEVQFVRSYTLKKPNSVPFSYLEQLSESTVSQDDEGYQNTQNLLNDLLEPEPPAPASPPSPPAEQENGFKVPPVPPVAINSVIRDPKPCTSAASTMTEELPSVSTSDPIEILKELDLDLVLNCLAELYGIDAVIEKAKEMKGDNVEKSAKNEELNKKKEKRPTTDNDKDKKSSKKKHDDKKSKDKRHQETPGTSDNHKESHKDRRMSIDKPLKKLKPVEKPQEVPEASENGRRKSVDKPMNEPKPVERPPEVSNNNKEPHKDRRLSFEKPKPLVVRRKSVILDDLEVPSVVERLLNGHSSSDMQEDLAVVLSHHIEEKTAPEASSSGLKRKADEIMSPNESHSNETLHVDKRRHKNTDLAEIVKNLRPVPNTQPIEELYTASQLPPRLEEVPVPKEPEYTYKLFNKKKDRKAHNRVPEKKKEEKKIPEKKKQPEKRFVMPKISERRESTSSEDGLMSFLDKIDEATAEHSTPIRKNNENNSNNTLESIPPKDPRRDPKRLNMVAESSRAEVIAKPPDKPQPHTFAIPQVPQRRVPVEVPMSPFISAEGFKDPRLQDGLLPAIIKPPPPVPYDCRNILAEVLLWNVEWIGADDPPIVDDITKVAGVTSTFQSYGHYVNTFTSLLKLELFHSIVEAYPRKILNPRIPANLIATNNHYNHKFHCHSLISIQVNIPKISRADWFNIRQGELVVITSRTLSIDQYFGYITKTNDFQHQGKRHVMLSISVSSKFPIARLMSQNIDILFLEYIKVEMETFLVLQNLKKSPLLNYVLKPNEIEFNKKLVKPEKNNIMEKLNKSQFESMSIVTENIDKNHRKPHVILVEGPPGTGKSRLIASIIMQFVRNKTEHRILLCAPSNNAVDVLMEKLIEYRGKFHHLEERRMLKIVRFGEKITSTMVNNYSISSLVEAEIDRECTRVASSFSKDSEEEKDRQILIGKIHSLNKEMEKTECQKKEIIALKMDLKNMEHKMYYLKQTRRDMDQLRQSKRSKLLNNANIVASTLTSLPSLYNNCIPNFDIAIVDEATQATECATLMALSLGVKHLIMVGDTKQLPAMVRSPTAKDLGLGKSLFARMRETSNVESGNFLTLYTQYRMHPEIWSFSNAYFYQNKITNGSASTMMVNDTSYSLKPYLVFELESQQNMTQNPHCYNTDEIDFVINLLRTIMGLLHSKQYSIGVVTPYAKQKQLIEQKLQKELNKNHAISVFTIDAIQGQEKDIIVFSCVRTDGVGFLASPERLNVALTRARKSLFICGNFMSLRRVDIWDKLLENAQQRNVLIENVDESNLAKHLLK